MSSMTPSIIVGLATASLSAVVSVFALADSLGAFRTHGTTAWLTLYALLSLVSLLASIQWRARATWQQWHDIDVFVNGTTAANVLTLVVLVCEIHVFGVLHDTALCLPIIMLLALLPSVIVTAARRQRCCGAPRLTHTHFYTSLPPSAPRYIEAVLQYPQ